jgi:hypothetical protein
MEENRIESTHRNKKLEKSSNFLAVWQKDGSISHGKSQWKWDGESNHTSFLLDNMETQAPRTDPVNSGEDELLQKASTGWHREDGIAV